MSHACQEPSLNKRVILLDQLERLARVVQEVTQFFPIHSHPTPLLPELRDLFLTTFPLEVLERLLPFYHEPIITARAPRRPALVVFIRWTWACFSAELVVRQGMRGEVQRYAIRDRRERFRAGHYSPTVSSGPPSLGNQLESD